MHRAVTACLAGGRLGAGAAHTRSAAYQATALGSARLRGATTGASRQRQSTRAATQGSASCRKSPQAEPGRANNKHHEKEQQHEHGRCESEKLLSDRLLLSCISRTNSNGCWSLQLQDRIRPSDGAASGIGPLPNIHSGELLVWQGIGNKHTPPKSLACDTSHPTPLTLSIPAASRPQHISGSCCSAGACPVPQHVLHACTPRRNA